MKFINKKEKRYYTGYGIIGFFVIFCMDLFMPRQFEELRDTKFMVIKLVDSSLFNLFATVIPALLILIYVCIKLKYWRTKHVDDKNLYVYGCVIAIIYIIKYIYTYKLF